ncbi:ABC transporter-like, ATP-binding domain [Dillenia turbinata]|uniref:ABC transporter-like, ATP-binding domain n=1 Tax=Dillenia turbinata TaxID=194707 RepID=A0AAN8Z363_9MAGN
MEKSDELSSKIEEESKSRTTNGSFRMIFRFSFGTSLTLNDVNKYAWALFYVAIGVGSGAFLEGWCWARTAERQVTCLRKRYLQAVLRQNAGFYDTSHGTPMTSEVVTSISTDTQTIQGILGEKMPNFLTNISMFLTGQMAAIYLCWRLAIVSVPALTLLIIAMLVSGKQFANIGVEIQKAYAVADGLVQHALSSIRTVYSYVGEEQTVKRFSDTLETGLKLGIKQGVIKGIAVGSVGVSYAIWALQGWYGSTLVIDKGVKGGNAFTAGVCIIYAGFALGSSFINLRHFAEANIAAAQIFKMIDQAPTIDSADEKGKTMPIVKGELEFNNIYLAYPSRPGSLVLRNFNLRVMACQTVGLVGGSGSGKSTVINLLERFYDPIKGEILLDGIGIQTLQLKWLRSQMSLVTEPILFATSIKENILFGKEDATMDEIVGQLGAQMSEGQKQRICIARALLRDPRILLLDEATIIRSGQVVESGSHDQLMKKTHGMYSAMVQLQISSTKDETMPISEEEEEEEEEEESRNPLYSLNENLSTGYMSTFIGCSGAVCYGLVPPLQYLCMGALLSVYFIDNASEIRSETKRICFAFLSFAVFTFIMNVIQHYHFGIMGEKLTKRVREAVFAKIMTFEIDWFDQEDNNSGALCSRLATDASLVKTLVADLTVMQPFIIAAFCLKAIMIKRMSKKILKAQNKSSELASEAVGNHRIITAFSAEEKIMSLYDATQVGPINESHKQSWYAGLGLFMAQFLTAANSSLLFWYGARLLYRKEISYKHLFETFFILGSTGRIIAETASMTSDLSKGTDALKSVFLILERKSKMETDDPDGIRPEKLLGDIELKDVDFFYSTRPKQLVLRGINLKVEAGKVAALVCQSGSGKSTIIRMIERFYDPLRGSVEIDGIDIKSYNLKALRSHIALVSQEPTLFAGTTRENITYGKEDATEAEVVEAATLTNANDFISCMKDGYSTYCGERGMQLSGGQKQRLALARAILKKPAILLLDEPTSALDINSETSVQQALERTMVGKTSAVVAHRLSTIRKSDKISVVDHGVIIEEGSHEELLALGEMGAYFLLVKLQKQATTEASN